MGNRGTRWVLPVLAGLLAATACAVYNDSCPVTTPEVWSEGLPVDLDIRREYVRQCEAAVGNFLADALLNYPYTVDIGSGRVRMGLINAGAIRDKVSCGEVGSTRDRIPQGPITDQDVYQLLPFYEDAVVLVQIDAASLMQVLERAVSALGLPGNEGQEGYFLQLAGEGGIHVTVDCNQTAQSLDEAGAQIAVEGSRISSVCLGTAEYCADPAHFFTEGTLWLATLDFMVGSDSNGNPNDGFVGFHETGVEVVRTYLPVIEVVRYWLVHWKEEVSNTSNYPPEEGRLVYENCSLEEVCGAS